MNKLGSPEDRARRSAASYAAWQRGAYARRTWIQTPGQVFGLSKATVAAHTPEARAKVSRAHLGKPKSAAARAAMSLAARRRFATPEGRQHLMELGRRQRGRVRSEEARARLSDAIRAYWARVGPEERLRGAEHCLRMAWRAPGRRYEFLDRKGRLHVMRSRPEVRLAEALDQAMLDWYYEPARLFLSTGEIYVPDFYVEQWCSYLELKGNEARFSFTKVRRAVADGHPVMYLEIAKRSTLDDLVRFLAPGYAGPILNLAPPPQGRIVVPPEPSLRLPR